MINSAIIKQFLSYTWIGMSAVLLDLISLTIFKEFFGVRPFIAVIINQAFLILYVFTLNKTLTFKNTDLPTHQFIRFCILATWNYLFAVGAMFILNELYEVHHLIVRIGCITLAVSWNFLLYKKWVYRP